MNNYFVFSLLFYSFNIYSATLGDLPKNTDNLPRKTESFLRDIYSKSGTVEERGHAYYVMAIKYFHDDICMSEEDARCKLLEMSNNGNGNCNMEKFKCNFDMFKKECDAKRQGLQRQRFQCYLKVLNDSYDPEVAQIFANKTALIK